MRISLIGHACLLIEVDGIRIISDPWWSGPCFGAQWWNYPKPALEPLSERAVDFIYISHGHHDHYHPGTLKSFNRDVKLLVSANTNLGRPIRDLGFQVVEVSDEEEFRLSDNATCRIRETYAGDTFLAVSDSKEICVNLNDALHSAPHEIREHHIASLTALYPSIDYVFCGYGVASHFPNCYKIPGKNNRETAAKRQQYFNKQWAKIVNDLCPRFAFPFAADVVFLEHELFWVNEPTHNSERPTDAFRDAYPGASTQVLDISPGFTIRDSVIEDKILHLPFSAEEVKGTYRDSIDRANRHAEVDDRSVQAVASLLSANLETCNAYLKSYAGDYRVLVEFYNASQGIFIAKTKGSISARIVPSSSVDVRDHDVIYKTRLPYLKRSLTTSFGHEILFVGSGGMFEYPDASRVPDAIHREVMAMVMRHETPPTARARPSPKLLSAAKRLAKRVLGYSEVDLYDLQTWTVFET
ncbi:MAG: MBL fold metallo-hydrolase [Gammaproteobacteria bacterium]